MSNNTEKFHLSIKNTKHLALRLNFPEKKLIEVSEIADSLYAFKQIPKKSGGFRTISIPGKTLSKIQKAIHKILKELFVSPCTHGGIKKRSNLTNASTHCSQNTIFNLDLENFFPSITNFRVFSLFKDELLCSPKVSGILTNLCTVNGQVPQGGSMSVDLANLVLRKTDARLMGLAEAYGNQYTRYVDDLTFSGPNITNKFRELVKAIVIESGFKLNPKKEVVQKRHELQTVTGLSVRFKTPRVPRKTKREWRKERFIFDNKSSGTSKETNVTKKRIDGRLNYLKTIEGKLGS